AFAVGVPDAGAGVADLDHAGATGLAAVETRAHPNVTGSWTGLDAVQHDVHQHLLELRLARPHAGRVGRGVAHESNVLLAGLRVEQARDPTRQLRHVRRFALGEARPGEGQQIVDQAADAIDL